jgi:PAS domain S-box-containing protein
MGLKDNFSLRRRSFSVFLLISMILLVLCIVGFLALNDYLFTKSNFDQQSTLLEFQTEQNIDQVIRTTDAAWNIFDDNLNSRMEQGLDNVMQGYERAGRDPSKMDLTGLKKDLGGDFDIYLINESGMIAYTTYEPELGQDFKKVPYFYDYLTKIRNSSGFFPDRVVHELLGTGQFRKYGYMPTPDHKYILELGLSGFSFEEASRRLDTQQNIESIVSTNPYVEGFRVFNTMGRRSDNNSLPEESVRPFLKEVAENKKTLEISDPVHHELIRYFYVNLKVDRYGSDLSRIVEITYNTELQQETLTRLLLYHLAIAIAAICLGSALAIVLSRRQTRGITTIVKDVDLIARGDLDHRIGPTHSKEFTVLEESINKMVDSIKTSHQRAEDGEIFQKEMIDQLPVGIFMKTIAEGRYVFWNKACEKMFGTPVSAVLGLRDRDIFPPGVLADIEKEDAEARSNRIVIRNKVLSSRHHEGQVLHIIIVPISDSQGSLKYLLGIAEDVTPENMTLKMDLLFSITRHDILDHLSRIMSSLERAQLKNTHEDVQMFFDRTLGSVESIRNQITFMRALQDIGIISPKWQSVQQAFADAVRLASDDRVEIAMDLDDIEVFADPLLPRIFYSLLENSLHGGKNLSRIRISNVKRGDSLVLIYEDNGTGIPDDKKQLAFEPGFVEGAGLSLYIIRELLGFTGISITETGTAGVGYRFEISVPKDKFRFFD